MRLRVMLGLWLVSAAVATPAKVDFSREVRPILEKSCYACHGAGQQMAGLRLDSVGGAFRVVRPGKAEESPLYRRVAGLGEQARMPLGGPPLEAEKIARIREWIEGLEAGDLPTHWAYVAPQRPELPAVRSREWTRNPIDRFVLARLEQEGLAPSAEADRMTLLRRLSLDLVGLPPTLEEVDAFLRDKSKNAYEKQVERLLA